MKKIILSGLTALALIALAGCSTPSVYKPYGAATNSTTVTVTNQIAPELLRPDVQLLTLGPGDVIDAEILGKADSRATMAVGPDGKIYFNLLPGVDVWGLTLSETKARLEKELAKYESMPQVSVALRAVGSKQVWMLGRLNRPGVYPLTGPTTLLESIALAGGTSRSASQISTAELSDLRHSFIVRDGQYLPVNFDRLLRHGDMSQNIYLRPGDFVYVPFALAQEVYVMGAVRFPRALPYVDQMSLVSAIAGASGMVNYNILDRYDDGVMTADSDLSHVAVVRGSLTEPQVTIVDYRAIVHGRAPDVLLEPGDIVYVPNSPFVTLKRYINLIVNTFAATVAANEGVRAGGGTIGVGVSVPVGN